MARLVLGRAEERLGDGVVVAGSRPAGGQPRAVRPPAIASGACWLLRSEREIAPSATQPRPRDGPSAAIGRSAVMRPGKARPTAMRVHRSITAAM